MTLPGQACAVRLCWGSGLGVGCRQMQSLSNPRAYLELLGFERCWLRLGPGASWACHATLMRTSTPATLSCAPPSSSALPCSTAWSMFLAEHLRPWASCVPSSWIPLSAPTTTPLQGPATLSLPPDSPHGSFPALTTSWLPKREPEGCPHSSRCGFPSPTFLLRSEAWPSALKYRKSEVLMCHASLFFKVTDCAFCFSKPLDENF